MPQDKVFILRDFQDATFRDVLRRVIKKGVDDFIVEAPGLEQDLRQGVIFRDLVQPKLEEAAQVVLLANSNNINVAFEAGYTLGYARKNNDGRRPGVKIATAQAERPSWLSGGMLAAYHAPKLDDIEALRTLIRGESLVPCPPAIPPGKRTLVLMTSTGNSSAYRDMIVEEFDWDILPKDVPSLSQIEQLFEDVGRVVWIISNDEHDTRDGPEACQCGMLAGLVDGQGIPLEVFVSETHRDVADLIDRYTRFESIDELEPKLRALDDDVSPSLVPDVLARYAEFLRNRHGHLVPFFSHLGERTLSEVYVELAIDCGRSERADIDPDVEGAFERAQRLDGRLTLEQLLLLDNGTPLSQLDRKHGSTGRWLVLGEPGAGKSTIGRHLCFQLAGGCASSGGREGFLKNGSTPIPIFIPLASWAGSGQDPFEWTQSELRASAGDEAHGLAEALRSEAKKEGRIWILFDGLDEVSRERMEAARTNLNDLATATGLTGCRIVVTSRPAGLRHLDPTFQEAELQSLSVQGRRDLLDRWLPGRADALLQNLSPALEEISFNPLMLTLVAALFRQEERKSGSAKRKLTHPARRKLTHLLVQ